VTFHVHCSACDYGADADWVQGEYQLAGGVTLYVREELAWCLEENRLVRAEKLHLLDKLVAELAACEALADVEAEDDVTGFPITLEHRARRIAEARAAVDWRRRRVSPGRCLSCGTTSVARIWAAESPPHPGCAGGGVLRPAIISSLLRGLEHPPMFSEEGLRIDRR
jgi:hypothetical protein